MTSSGDGCTGVLDQGFIEHGLDRLNAASRARDAEGVLARAADLLRVVKTSSGENDVELFVRHSRRLRVRRERGDDRSVAAAGVETGVATRVRSHDGRLGFDARSGLDEATVRDSVGAAVDAATPLADGAVSWCADAEQTHRDLDEAPMPSVAELGSWLDDAWSALERWRDDRRRAAVELVDGWVEVAATVEAIVSTDGLRAVRTRCRGRARARTSHRKPPAEPAALELAARDWRKMDRDGWVGLLADRVGPGTPDETLVTPGSVFVFSPESASILVQALVMTLSGHDPLPSIGAGWCVRDDPRGVDGEFGGCFDDAGFPAESVVLADGGRTHEPLPVQGRLRRGSYRDRPAPRPWRLIVDPPEIALPERVILVSACRVLPLGGRNWCLELETATLDHGAPAVRHPTTLLMTDPTVLVRRCVGGAGLTRSLANGVRTPALVFDGLDPRRRR